MKREILFLAHRTPFPPDRGDKIRSHHILKALADLAPVHVGCLAETDGDEAEEAALASVAASYCMPRRSKPLPLAGIQALATGEPISLTAFANSGLKAWVEHTLSTHPIGAIYVFSGQMGQYVPEGWEGRLIVDFVDADSAKFEAYAAQGSGPMALVNRREGKLLRSVERKLEARADTSLLVSEAEADVMRGYCSGGGDIRALGNGIDCDHFNPAAASPHPEIAADPGPHFLFTGQMDYAPNIAAVERFATAILPGIIARHPQSQFHIVGRAPSTKVRRLANLAGVKVWGEVPDTRPFIAAADIVVAPLTIARGVQNKVLEAMAMARAVLVSPEAATGIEANAGEHFFVCDDDDDFVRQSLALLECPADCLLAGQAAHQFVRDRMSWPAMLAPLGELMGFSDDKGGRRDAA